MFQFLLAFGVPGACGFAPIYQNNTVDELCRALVRFADVGCTQMPKYEDAQACAIEFAPWAVDGRLSSGEARTAFYGIPEGVKTALAAMDGDTRCLRDQVFDIIIGSSAGGREARSSAGGREALPIYGVVLYYITCLPARPPSSSTTRPWAETEDTLRAQLNAVKSYQWKATEGECYPEVPLLMGATKSDPFEGCSESDFAGDFNGINGFTLDDAIYVAEVWAGMERFAWDEL
eukprot:CAMPEP_0119360452 /NCGR_PEP_ID=MMETSP1334-20130426/8051_1 /TAXON_ID=127549 /ORGANISM="Calcidiscus leptoporus, Strain RCC1130" /LENGTH=232 /DNA_ID=CAMNT_0007375295 /DNA_START=35 /DNA_END=733 /DNA_ORIENTATION=-